MTTPTRTSEQSTRKPTADLPCAAHIARRVIQRARSYRRPVALFLTAGREVEICYAHGHRFASLLSASGGDLVGVYSANARIADVVGDIGAGR